MQISAEIRWFWEEGKDDGLTKASETWFTQMGIAPGGGDVRPDDYAHDPQQIELGIKKRGNKPGLEVKGLIACLSPISTPPFQGPPELWGKWSTTLLDPPKKIVTVSKTRWLRKLDLDGEPVVEVPLGNDEKPLDAQRRLPTLGCHIERTRVEIPGLQRGWWTVGFEAFGPAHTVERLLHRSVEHVRARAPDFGAALQMSYPRWLAHVAP